MNAGNMRAARPMSSVDGPTGKESPRALFTSFRIAPLKLFVPTNATLLGAGNYAYTLYRYRRSPDMSALLWRAAVIIFLIGLVSEQITALVYRRDV